MKVLYIGGTGEISYSCVLASDAAGQHVAVFNRGQNEEPLSPTVRQIVGDVHDPAGYSGLVREHFDVVCQFLAYKPAEIERDIALFGGKCGQYIFISTASAYEKPPKSHVITENTPLGNPFWAYSQAKAEMEAILTRAHADKRLNATIVRPSHTIRRRFPGTFVKGDVIAWRMLNGRPVIIHGDGTALWTLTHSEQFAQPFIRLLGNERAFGEAFHIAPGAVYNWNQIIGAMAEALGANPRIVHVPSDTIVRYNGEWAGPLFGDKAWSATFDQTKLQAAVGESPAPRPLLDIFAGIAPHYHERARSLVPDRNLHALLDRMTTEQDRLGE